MDENNNNLGRGSLKTKKMLKAEDLHQKAQEKKKLMLVSSIYNKSAAN